MLHGFFAQPCSCSANSVSASDLAIGHVVAVIARTRGKMVAGAARVRFVCANIQAVGTRLVMDSKAQNQFNKIGVPVASAAVSDVLRKQEC